jgi:heat shock protein HslJ
MAWYDYRNKINMGTKLKSFLLTASLFALLSGLRAQEDSTKMEAPKKPVVITKLVGKWLLIPALEADTAGGRMPDIQFDSKDTKFSGNTGCNRMAGTYLATDSTLHFSEKMITTRLYCAGYNESAFLQNLLRVDSYKFRKGLLIFTVGNVEVFRWKRKATTAKKTGKV